MSLAFRFRSCLAALALAAMPALAAPGDADFNRGIAASRAGAWSQARDYFLAAQRAGLDRPALHYNLGVVYYRLGNDEQARASFRRAAADPRMAALSHYNLGLLAARANRTDEARGEFRRAKALANDDRLRALAEEQIALLPRATGTDRRWRGNATLGVGYDDSLLDPLTQTATVRSPFVELLGGARGPLAGDNANGLLGEAAAYVVRYTDQEDYDSSLFRLGLAGVASAGAWRTEAKGQYEFSTLGGEDYLGATHVGLLGDYAARKLSLEYRLSHFRALQSLYEPLEGVRHQARIATRWSAGAGSFRLSYLYEYNDREDLGTADSFTSYSPVRHEIGGRYALSLGNDWDLSVDLAYRASRYLDANRYTDGTEITREDERVTAGMNVSYNLSPRVALDVGVTHTENTSNITLYDYTQNIYTVGIGARF